MLRSVEKQIRAVGGKLEKHASRGRVPRTEKLVGGNNRGKTCKRRQAPKNNQTVLNLNEQLQLILLLIGEVLISLVEHFIQFMFCN